jgi:hypothetical protein
MWIGAGIQGLGAEGFQRLFNQVVEQARTQGLVSDRLHQDGDDDDHYVDRNSRTQTPASAARAPKRGSSARKVIWSRRRIRIFGAGGWSPPLLFKLGLQINHFDLHPRLRSTAHGPVKLGLDQTHQDSIGR